MSIQEADRQLIILGLEMYDTVIRLYNRKGVKNKLNFKLQGLYFLIYPDEENKGMHLDVDMQGAKYLFRMKHKGWLTIYESKDIVKRERFEMRFNNQKMRFVYRGDRDFCIEICPNLMNLVNVETSKN